MVFARCYILANMVIYATTGSGPRKSSVKLVLIPIFTLDIVGTQMPSLRIYFVFIGLMSSSVIKCDWFHLIMLHFYSL